VWSRRCKSKSRVRGAHGCGRQQLNLFLPATAVGSTYHINDISLDWNEIVCIPHCVVSSDTQFET
jgi:hypothetical protein